LTTLAIDLTVVAIVAFCAWRGYRNGLIRGVFGVVALVASLLIANIAAMAYSEEFKEMLTPFVGGIIDKALVDIAEEDVDFDLSEFEEESEDFITAYCALQQIGLPESSAARIASMATEEDIPVGSFLSDLISDKLSSVLAFVAVFGIAFVLLAIIFAVIGNLIGFVFSLPGLKLIDIIAGVAFGLAKGLLIVLTLAVIVRYAGLLAPETLKETAVLRYLVNNNPIANMLGV